MIWSSKSQNKGRNEKTMAFQTPSRVSQFDSQGGFGSNKTGNSSAANQRGLISNKSTKRNTPLDSSRLHFELDPKYAHPYKTPSKLRKPQETQKVSIGALKDKVQVLKAYLPRKSAGIAIVAYSLLIFLFEYETAQRRVEMQQELGRGEVSFINKSQVGYSGKKFTKL